MKKLFTSIFAATLLDKIPDHNPKVLITLDPEEVSRRGVRQINAINWLLSY